MPGPGSGTYFYAQAKEIYRKLGTYLEISPSGKGLHLFALCDEPLKGGNAKNGREMYSKGRFMTVTGDGAKRDIVDASNALKSLHDEWFGSECTTGKFLWKF